MPKFNGHPSYEHWNVSLWINNDEHLYRLAQHTRSVYPKGKAGRESAARHLLGRLQDEGIRFTGDGVAYTFQLLAYTLKDIED